jgi:hypothetical protein
MRMGLFSCTLSDMTTELEDLQQRIGEANGKSGFNEYDDLDPQTRILYIGNKLMLVASELAEAQDELRTGHDVTETYYDAGQVPTTLAVEFASGGEAQEYWDARYAQQDGPKKPEGFPSEIADAVIRLFGIAYEVGIDLSDIIYEKIVYNESRPYRHGKQF